MRAGPAIGGAIAGLPAVPPTVARLAVDPDQPTRLAVVDALSDQLHIPPLLLSLNPARRRPPPVPHCNLRSRVGVATSAGIRPHRSQGSWKSGKSLQTR